MPTIHQLKNEIQEKQTALFNELKVFFAFSDEQFDSQKKAFGINEEIVSIGLGGYCPKSNTEKFKIGHKKIFDDFQNYINENNLQEEHICYELSNHECFYTGDYSEVFFLPYTKEMIRDTFYKFRNQYSQ